MSKIERQCRDTRFRREIALDKDVALAEKLTALRIAKGFSSESDTIRFVMQAAVDALAQPSEQSV